MTFSARYVDEGIQLGTPNDTSHWILFKKITVASCIGIIILVGFLSLGVFILFVAKSIVDHSLTEYADPTTSGLYANSITNTTIAFVTVAYVFLTGLIVSQSRKEQQIRDIENRLEKYYIPAIDILEDPQTLRFGNPYMIISMGYISGRLTNSPITYPGLIHLRKYSYLADKETYNKYLEFINKYREPKTIESKDGSLVHEPVYLHLLESLNNDIKRLEKALSNLKT